MKFRLRIPLLIIVWLLSVAVALSGTMYFSVSRAEESSKQTIQDALYQIGNKYPSLISDEADILDDFTKENRAVGRIVRFLQEHDLEGAVPKKDHLEKYAQLMGASYVAVIDPKGRIAASTGKALAKGQLPDTSDIKSISDMLETSAVLKDDEISVYETDLKNGWVLRYEINNEDFNQIKREAFSWQTILKKVDLPNDAFFVAISKEDGTVLIHRDEDLVGKDIKTLGYKSTEELDSVFGEADENGFRWKKSEDEIDSRILENDSEINDPLIPAGMIEFPNVYFICEIPGTSRNAFFIEAITSLPALFALCSLLVLLYILFHLVDLHYGRVSDESDYISALDSSSYRNILKKLNEWTWARRILVCSLVVFVLFCIFSVQVQVMSSGAEVIASEESTEALIQEAEEDNQYLNKHLDKWYRERNLRLAEEAAFIIQQDDSLRTREAFKELQSELNVDGIYLFDVNGKVQETSTLFDHLDLYENEKDPMSVTFIPLLEGWSSRTWTPLAEEEEDHSDMYAGVSIRDKEDLTAGCIGIVKKLHQGYSNVTNYDFYSDVIESASSSNEKSILVFSSGQTKTTLFLIAELAVYLLLIGLIGSFRQNAGPDEQPKEAVKQYSSLEEEFAALARAHKDEYFFIRWHWNTTPVWRRSPEQRLLFIVKGLMFAAAAWIIYSSAGFNDSLRAGSIPHTLFGNHWDRGINIYAITAVEFFIIVTIVVVILLHGLIYFIAYFSSRRGESVCHLVYSLVSYSAFFMILFYSLILLGIDTKTMLASAGVLTIVIGFGAQNLIADILSGLFMVFEDVIHVGDYVIVADSIMGETKGIIMEIGMRMTKLKYYGNITSVNNSSMRVLHNKSKGDAFVSCLLSVNFNEKLDRVEEIIDREIPVINKRLQETGCCTSNLQYTGVKSFDRKYYVLRFKIFSVSYRHGYISRMLNGEILKMCRRNNIQISDKPMVDTETMELEGLA